MITYYSTGGLGKLVPDLDQPTPESNQNEPYLDFLTYMLALPDSELPQTITSSYGEDEQSVPEPYARKVCDMFGQLGLRGVSILISSGDTGPGSACQTNDGKNTTRFLPIFPASCPYVTSVGGTTFIEPERAVSFSSGGFSDLWERPGWQNNAVKGYLNFLGEKWKGLYNSDGRGCKLSFCVAIFVTRLAYASFKKRLSTIRLPEMYANHGTVPDVAAQGQSFRIVEQDPVTGNFEEWMIGGTS